MGRAKQLDGTFHNAVAHPLLPKMTGLDEEVQWAEFMFHSFNLRLSLGYDDKLARCFHSCLNWATEPIGQVSSPAAELILNNDIMGPHRAGAVAASGSGDVVEEVEASETEVPELVEDGPMDVDEDIEGGEVEVDEEEEEEDEEEEEEDDDRLWPVSSHPLVSSFVRVAPERRLTG
jgi:hypothetical protein